MMDHGARHTNDGRNTLASPDRHQPHAREKLDKALEGAQKRVAKQAERRKVHQDKVAESAPHGHGQRLVQRQRALARGAKECKDAQDQHAKLRAHDAALGPPRERMDRDCRPQTIRTLRTLLLEHALISFMAALLGHLHVQVSLDCLLRSLFARSGARLETDSQVIYWVNTTGLSVSYQRLLTEVVHGLCAMDVREQGKPMRVRLKALPP